MSLNEQILEDIKKYTKNGHTEKRGVLRLVRNNILKLEKDRQNPEHHDHNVAITDADAITMIQREIKQQEESLEWAIKSRRPELAGELELIIVFLKEYLPTQLSREEIANNVCVLIDQVGDDFRAVMPLAANLMKGRADGKLINQVVTEMTVKK